MISESVINLYRSLFMRALSQDPVDPLRSQYGQPFLLVVERSNVRLCCGVRETSKLTCRSLYISCASYTACFLA